MENKVVLKIEGLETDGAKEKILRRAGKMPGIEYLSVDADTGTITVLGGDIDRLGLEDEIEGLGCRIVR